MTSQVPDIMVRCWGARGTVACSGPATQRYGGNTSCVEVRCGDQLFILDGGTGLRALGQGLLALGRVLDVDIFFSHCHLDHMLGLPYFAPAFVRRNQFRLWAGHLLPERTLRGVVTQMMASPLYPKRPDIFEARMDFCDFRGGDTIAHRPGINVRTAPLNHPDGATGYRIEHGGKALAYITDTEHRAGTLDRNVLALADGADLMIYDANFTDDEYASHVGWGHSTWQEGVRLADAARAKVLAIFHHDPDHDDAFLDGVAAEAEAARPGTVVVSEGAVFRL